MKNDVRIPSGKRTRSSREDRVVEISNVKFQKISPRKKPESKHEMLSITRNVDYNIVHPPRGNSTYGNSRNGLFVIDTRVRTGEPGC